MAEDRNGNEKHVQELDDRERIAALQRDVSALEQLWSDEFVVNAPNNQVVVGRRAVLETFVSSGVINFSRFDREIEFVRADGSYVIIMGLEKLVPMNSAPGAGLVAGQAVERRFTNIWKNEAGTWRMFARHANVLPNH
jgi:hypothetical protein